MIKNTEIRRIGIDLNWTNNRMTVFADGNVIALCYFPIHASYLTTEWTEYPYRLEVPIIFGGMLFAPAQKLLLRLIYNTDHAVSLSISGTILSLVTSATSV